MKKGLIIVFLVIGFCLITSGGHATVYVSDKLEVPLRIGPGPKHRIVSMLQSGEKVTVLSEEEGWSHVRSAGVSGDREGWILSRYLMNREPWENRVQAIKAENARLRETLYPMEGDLREIKTRNADLAAELKEKTKAFATLEENYASLRDEAAGFLELREGFEQMQSHLADREAELAEVIEENENLRSSHRHIWFLAGALVLLVGLLIGLTMGRRDKKRISKLYL